MKLLAFLSLTYFLSCDISFAQTKEIDSLRLCLARFSILPKHEADTNYLNTLNELSLKYQRQNIDSSIFFAKTSVDLCNKIGYERGKIEGLRSIGFTTATKGNYPQALVYYEEALGIAKKINNKVAVGRLYNNIAIIYKNQGRYPEALEMQFNTLKIKEEVGDKRGMAVSFGNIGIIYKNQDKYEDALSSYQKALKIFESLKDKIGIVTSIQNIGTIYYIQANYDEALKAHTRTLEMTKEIGDTQGLMYSLNDIANVYAKQTAYTKALENYRKSLKINEGIGDEYQKSSSLKGMAVCYENLYKYDSALYYAKEALTISQKIGRKEVIRDTNHLLSGIYKALGKHDLALVHHELFYAYADSLNNAETEKKTAQLQAKYEYEKKEEVLKAQHDKQANKQQLIIISISIGLFSVLGFAYVLFYSRKKVQKINEELSLHQEEIKSLNENLEVRIKERTHTLEIANEKLSQYAFSNSHLVRRPLANIKGLIVLFNMNDSQDPQNLKILEMLQISANELDAIVHEINNNLQMPEKAET